MPYTPRRPGVLWLSSSSSGTWGHCNSRNRKCRNGLAPCTTAHTLVGCGHTLDCHTLNTLLPYTSAHRTTRRSLSAHHLQHEPPSVAEARDQARSHAPHGSLCKPHSCTCNGCTTTRSARLRRARALRWRAARPRGACRDPQDSEALIHEEHDQLRALRGGEVARARRSGDRMAPRGVRQTTARAPPIFGISLVFSEQFRSAVARVRSPRLCGGGTRWVLRRASSGSRTRERSMVSPRSRSPSSTWCVQPHSPRGGETRRKAQLASLL